MCVGIKTGFAPQQYVREKERKWRGEKGRVKEREERTEGEVSTASGWSDEGVQQKRENETEKNVRTRGGTKNDDEEPGKRRRWKRRGRRRESDTTNSPLQ